MAILSKGNETKLLIGGLLVAGFVAYKVIVVKEDIKEVITKDLNPVNDENIVNKQVSSLVNRFTDGAHSSLGSFTFCLLNSDAAICNPQMLKTASALDISFYGDDGEINPQLIALYEQEKDFYEEDVL